MSNPARIRPSGWPDSSHSPSSSSTSASLSSSFSSDSAASGMHESLSDFTHSDHSASKPLPAPIPRPGRVHDLAVAAPRPRSSSLAVAMGQAYSKPSSPSSASAHLTQKGIAITAAAANTGLKLKRAFANRRKKSEDATKLFSGKDRAEEQGWTTVTSPAHLTSSSSNTTVPVEVNAPTSRNPKGGKLTLQLAAQVLSGSKRQHQKDSALSPVPPPLPPKPAVTQRNKQPLPSPPSSKVLKTDNRGSIIPISPGISSAVNFMISNDEQEKSQAKGKEITEQSDDNQKDIWRKSDSTMSHHTIRPGAGVGNRPSRPVSMAESLNSNHTVVPGNKRLSQLLADSELDTPEEDDSSFKSASEELPPAPTSTNTVKNRRSMSLNLGAISPKVNLPPPPASSAGSSADMRHTKSYPDSYTILAPSVPASETPTLTRAAASGVMSQSNNHTHSPGANIRGRLAALTSSGSNPRPDRNRTPPSSYHRNTPSPQPQPQAHSRTAAISISGFGPAAGLAKRAVEKMGRAWGGFSSNSSGSVYSSSSSNAGHPSDHALARTNSNTSNGAMPSGKGKSRRTPDAPSGAWSLTSGASSDSDGVMPPPEGPSLGKCIRLPLRVRYGEAATSGVVFGRELKFVVKETAVGIGVDPASINNGIEVEPEGNVDSRVLKTFEQRALPALVARCAQHILLWGVHEEGLFRVSGRPSHVTKLRNEFDTGADFDIRSCSPGDLDPHAVASVFKAFLRELPEPILTHSLIPYFEAALSQENEVISREQTTQPRTVRGPTLPSNPKNGIQGLRKPPSLSTLAMPNFSGMRPPSRSLCNALKSLIAQLPQENKDLIQTVTELIKATAKESRQTKMPLSNLLLVFCPSLNMNPPLLRVLCEAGDIWEGPPIESPVLDIKRESVVLDISPSTKDSDSASQSGVDQEEEIVQTQDDVSEQSISAPASIASNPPSQEHTRNTPRTRPLGPRRAHTPAIVVDNDTASGMSTSGSSIDSGASSSFMRSSFDSGSTRDDVISYTSTSEDQTSPSSRGFMVSSPPLTSSVESLATPSSSSVSPSLQDLSQQTKDIEPRPPVEIADEEDPLTPRRILDPETFQFPSIETAPPTPSSPRKFMPALSLPGLSSPTAHVSPTNSAPASPRHLRVKKPSLQLLFSKRSVSQLSSSNSSGGIPYISSPYLQAPRAASDSSVSTPSSTMTAPQSSTFTLPPVLDTPIESSPLRFGLGFDNDSPKDSPPPEDQTHTTCKDSPSLPLPTPTPAPGETPIASQYCGPSTSNLSLPLPSSTSSPYASHLRTQPTLRSRQASKTSLASTSSNHLGLLDDEDREDWTQSVLLAADSEGNWNLPSGH
ncbi:RhoGAP-domain-containing protein [Dendrothele bispora CBS 962.96]|uniref:RhoGAP-domain-containing protein n=1 Tax=Dendrothele bispora (strain CBS 962.96) TaxID=1314807 RepID=A0A4S8MQM4_DENBC|nr:RhoGAP-domain-containing protein [Dendrothele bispora CBS 962.96]